MEKLHFEIEINALKEKVWKAMLEDKTYREWTAAFNPSGSYYEGDWSEGSKILFLGEGENGVKEGMVAMIEKNTPYDFISIKHMGMIRDGVEDTTSEEVLKWVGAHENYTFKELEGGKTQVEIDIDITDEYKDMFKDMWPKALQKLKEISER